MGTCTSLLPTKAAMVESIRRIKIRFLLIVSYLFSTLVSKDLSLFSDVAAAKTSKTDLAEWKKIMSGKVMRVSAINVRL